MVFSVEVRLIDSDEAFELEIESDDVDDAVLERLPLDAIVADEALLPPQLQIRVADEDAVELGVFEKRASKEVGLYLGFERWRILARILTRLYNFRMEETF